MSATARPSSSSVQGSQLNGEPDIQGKKRRLQAVVTAMHSRKKKKSMSDYEKLRHDGRWLFRALGPFIDLSYIIHAGMRLPDDDNEPVLAREDAESTDIISERLSKLTAEQRHKIRTQYHELLRLVFDLKGFLQVFDQEEDVFDKIVNLLDSAAAQGRNDDTARLKAMTLTFMPAPVLTDMPESLLNSAAAKQERGWHHLRTARMLCPMALLSEFDSDPNTFSRKVRDGEIAISGDAFPLFLYDLSAFDPDDDEAGLLRGEILLKGARAVFSGPRSADKTTPGRETGGRDPLVDIYSDRWLEVTPENIAYIAVLTRFSLSSQQTWTAADGNFDGRLLFDEIVALFEDPTSQWCKETLAWWTMWIFGSARPQQQVRANAPPQSTRARLAAQRATRAARLSQAPHQ